MAPKIAIIGAGPGGLCLANILQRNNIQYTMFEGDKTPYERNQGGTLDLDPKFGQQAMKDAGLWDEFCKYSRPEANVMKIVRIDGKVLWDGNGPDQHEALEEYRKPEIDREKLKDILYESLRPENLRFGMHLQEVVADDHGRYDLHFREGVTEFGFDIVIGADGAWSKVRNLLTDKLPHYSGISALELWIEDVDKSNPWLSQYVGAGSCFSFDDGRAVQCQRLGSGTIRTYACLRKPETFIKDGGIDFTDPDEARKQYVERYYSDAGDDLKRVILESNSKLIARPLYMLPVGFRWDHKPGITLLGDAAHLMTPFAGVGVNAALKDASDLGQSIIEASDGSEDPTRLRAAVQDYETRLFDRGEAFARRTWNSMQTHFSAGGSEAFAKRHRDAYAAAR